MTVASILRRSKALARYRVTAESPSKGNNNFACFEGTPAPATVILTGVLAWAALNERIRAAPYGRDLGVAGWKHQPLRLKFALSGIVMISRALRIPKR